MVVAGVHLDRAWSQLGTQFGHELRRWSRDTLAHLVGMAGNRGVTSLILAGDLLDRETIVPDTIDYAGKVLGAFPGSALIVPGRSDWIGGAGPYELDLWQSNTTIWRAAEFGQWDAMPSLWASAWTSPAACAPRVPDNPESLILLRPAATDLAGQLPPGSRQRLITTGALPAEGLTVLRDVVHEPEEAGGSVLIVDSATGSVEYLSIPGQPGSQIRVDVTGLGTTERLGTALGMALKGAGGPIIVRLTGELAPRVLLPGFGGPELPPGAVTNLGALRYGQLELDSADRSAEAEFVRAAAASGAGDLERHQAIALGLTALAETSMGA
jgi:hypothetical protein